MLTTVAGRQLHLVHQLRSPEPWLVPAGFGTEVLCVEAGTLACPPATLKFDFAFRRRTKLRVPGREHGSPAPLRLSKEIPRKGDPLVNQINYPYSHHTGPRLFDPRISRAGLLKSPSPLATHLTTTTSMATLKRTARLLRRRFRQPPPSSIPDSMEEPSPSTPRSLCGTCITLSTRETGGTVSTTVRPQYPLSSKL